MASNTPRLGLYKKDPIADANDTFNIQTMLNDNWDKIDGKVAILGPDGKILSEQLPQQSLPSASTTQAGIVQLNDTLTSTSTTQAATANAVKQVNDALAAHSADTVSHVPYAVATGTANTYAVTLNPAPTAYVDGMAVSVKINVDSTGASTLNVNGLGAKPLKKANGNDATNLKANGVYTFRYNASTGNFILQGEGGSGNAQPSDVLSGKTFTNDSGEQTGTMPNRGAMTITPTTVDQPIPQGYHNGSGVVKGDADLIPSNIKDGVDIFGVMGTLIPFDTTAGETLVYTAATERNTNNPNFVRVKAIKINYTGTVRVRYDHRSGYSSDSCISHVRKNGVQYSSDYETNGQSYQTITIDVPVNKGDVVEVWYKCKFGTYGAYVSNFRIYAGSSIQYVQLIQD